MSASSEPESSPAEPTGHALQRVVQPGLGDLQTEIDEAVHESVREVRRGMAGRPSEEVYAALISRLRKDVVALNIHEEHAYDVAARISELDPEE